VLRRSPTKEHADKIANQERAERIANQERAEKIASQERAEKIKERQRQDLCWFIWGLVAVFMVLVLLWLMSKSSKS
jgi:predicted nucleic acid-binding Zn ribbon protein